MTSSDELRARALAFRAHDGQVDLAGEPYVLHVHRVAEALEDDQDKVVGFLHDVIEDAPERESEVAAFGPVVYDAVLALTHKKHEPLDDYLDRIVLNPIAVRVKLADVADNLDPQRMITLAQTDPTKAQRLTKKYARTLERLVAAL